MKSYQGADDSTSAGDRIARLSTSSAPGGKEEDKQMPEEELDIPEFPHQFLDLEGVTEVTIRPYPINTNPTGIELRVVWNELPFALRGFSVKAACIYIFESIQNEKNKAGGGES